MTTPHHPDDQQNILRAALWMGGAILAFTSMAIAGRAVSYALDTFEIMMWRSALGVAVMAAIVLATRRFADISFRDLPLHAIRNLAHFTGQNLWFYAITLIPLAQVFALEFTSPLWILLLAPIVLGERPGWARVAIAFCGFGGVVLVARPWVGGIEPGIVWAGLAAVGFALTGLFTRRLTRTESTLSILVWLTVMQLVLGIGFAGWDGDIALPSVQTAPWLVLIGLAGLCAHWCLTNALALAPASTIMPVDFARLPLIAVVGAVIYGEAIEPLTLLGGGIVFAAAWANIRLASVK